MAISLQKEEQLHKFLKASSGSEGDEGLLGSK
jgi:hypothetical protein